MAPGKNASNLTQVLPGVCKQCNNGDATDGLAGAKELDPSGRDVPELGHLLGTAARRHLVQ